MRLRLVAVVLALAVGVVWYSGRQPTDPAVAPSGAELEEEPAPTESRADAALATPGEADRRVPLDEAERSEPAPEAAPDPAPVELRPAGFEVLVVSEDDVGVGGVPVVLGLVLGSDERARGKTFSEAVTDPDGLAILDLDAYHELQRGIAEHGAGLAISYRVRVDLPFDEPPARTLETLAEGDRVRLVLPPFGSVRVNVATRDDAPVPDGGHVKLVFESEAGWKRLSEPLVDAAASFQVVPLGRELTGHAYGATIYEPGSVTGLGPTAPGQTVDLDVVLGERFVQVAGRVVDAADRPVTGRIFVAMLPVGDMSPLGLEPSAGYWEPVLMEPDGRFSCPLQRERNTARQWLVAVRDGGRVASWRGPMDVAPGETHDVGTLVLEFSARRRLLVAGRVSSDDGQPLRGIRVDVRARDEHGRWLRVATEPFEVAEDGTFEMFTTEDDAPARIRLSAGAVGCVGASLGASPGDRGLELVLQRGGELRGHFAVDDEDVARHLSVYLESPDFSRNPDSFFGSFGVDNLVPGSYAVVARMHGTSWEFGRVEGVVVPPGGRADDPRLSRIDLGAAARSLRLEIRDEAGELLPMAHVRVKDGAGDGGSLRTDDDGILAFAVPSDTGFLRLSGYEDGVVLGGSWSSEMGASASVTLVPSQD